MILVVRSRCAHRATPLSLGALQETENKARLAGSTRRTGRRTNGAGICRELLVFVWNEWDEAQAEGFFLQIARDATRVNDKAVDLDEPRERISGELTGK